MKIFIKEKTADERGVISKLALQAVFGYVYAKTCLEVKAKLHEVSVLTVTNKKLLEIDSDLFSSIAIN